MLPDSFFEWWFTPWAYAVNASAQMPAPPDWLGQRDGYRIWCKQAGVPADLPAHLDPGWHVVTGDGPPEMMATARLFAGLIAAREHNQSVLGELAFADRKWCVSIAATQPLRGWQEAPYAADDPIEVRGMFEMARRVEQRFNGLWSRLRLIVPPAIASRVDSLLEVAGVGAENADASAARAQRCWTMCRARVSSTNTNMNQ
jgi:hypothetical protein